MVVVWSKFVNDCQSKQSSQVHSLSTIYRIYLFYLAIISADEPTNTHTTDTWRWRLCLCPCSGLTWNHLSAQPNLRGRPLTSCPPRGFVYTRTACYQECVPVVSQRPSAGDREPEGRTSVRGCVCTRLRDPVFLSLLTWGAGEWEEEKGKKERMNERKKVRKGKKRKKKRSLVRVYKSSSILRVFYPCWNARMNK